MSRDSLRGSDCLARLRFQTPTADVQGPLKFSQFRGILGGRRLLSISDVIPATDTPQHMSGVTPVLGFGP